ncbi:hypothetical protein [Aggregatilinea lenta]|uniref:hypothetical protein n=1 Tax=Aggregatilinea lenta TaxID=913108 RepID=UPI000E5A702A|nr:hypothetical protein [Aggregatilinea lenta]
MASARSSEATRATLAVLVVALIAAFGLRVWDLGGPSVWHDEAWSIRAIRDPINTPDDNTPPVYYAVMHVLWRGAGDSAFALRLGSVLIDLITVALAAHVAWRWAGRDGAILAAILFALSPLLWAYAREIRAYVAVPLLALVLLRGVDCLLAGDGWRRWRVWLAVLVPELILLYTHNLSVPVVAWLNAVVVLAWAWARQWRRLALWLGSQAVLLVLYLPWLFGQSPSGTLLNSPPELSLGLVWKIWQSYFAPVPVQIGADNALTVASALIGAAALFSAGAVLAWDRRRPAMLVLSQAILLPAFSTAELLAANIDFHPRYYIVGVPAALLLIALGAHSVPSLDLRRLAVPAGIALAFGVATASFFPLFGTPRYQHDDFRALAKYYARLPEDAIVLVPYGWEPALEEYYIDRLDVRAQVLGIDLHSDEETAVAAINAALAERTLPVHVELLTWYQLPADVRGMYPCLLDAAGGREGDATTVQGITTTGYRIERRVGLADLSVEAVDYGRVTLDGAALGGETSLCLRTDWTLRQASDDDWRVAVRLLTNDPAGWIVTRADGDIRLDDQALSAEWDVGETGGAYTLLRLPPGTPPGDYALQMNVYSAAHPGGLDRLVSGIPSGRVTSLGDVALDGATSLAFGAISHPTEIPVSEGVTLVGYDVPESETLTPGQELRITLYLTSTLDWASASLDLSGAGWSRSEPVTASAGSSLDWHAFVIPAEAYGEATLALMPEGGDPVPLATWTVEPSDHLLSAPPFDVAVDAAFSDLATLAGFSTNAMTVSPDDPLTLTLVWRADETTSTSYKVFTHLLDVDGMVVAQHDGYPVEGDRPTSGWVPGEYVLDSHTLDFERDDYHGPAQVEVGLYDPDTGERVPLSNGADHIILPVEITVD